MKNLNKPRLIGLVLLSIFMMIVLSSCSSIQKNDTEQRHWEKAFKEKLDLLGHRNWILVVDKAFPLQNGDGIDVIYTDEALLTALAHILLEIENASHVKPIIYTDKEMDFIDPAEIEGLKAYRQELSALLGDNPNTILHDTVFTRIKEASELFNILVLKTNETIAYSSVFIELDCKYWSTENEAALRQKMLQE